MTEQMHAGGRIHDYGGPEVLTLGEAPRPEPPPGQLLVRVKAAGVNPANLAFRRGAFKQFMALQFPWTPGLEWGVVEPVGQDVSTFRWVRKCTGFSQVRMPNTRWRRRTIFNSSHPT